MDNRMMLLRMIQQYDFVLYELALYLDTHPNCANALAKLEEVKEMRTAAADEYTMMYGPLTAAGASADKNGEWNWINGPWPWERSDN